MRVLERGGAGTKGRRDGGTEGQRASLCPSVSPSLRLGVAGLFALLTFALRLPELDRYATIDESRWVGRSADFAEYVRERDFDKTFIVGHPGVTTMWLGALGMGPERTRAFSFREGQTDVTRREGYLEALVAARRATTVANALLLGGMVWLAWGLFGAGPAVLGGVLLALDPFYGAHARLIHLDALLAGCMGLAALASLAFWGGRGWPYAVLAGLCSGLAFLTKAPSVFLLAFVPGLAVFELARSSGWRSGRGWARTVGGLAVWAGVAWGVCLVLWPALRAAPSRVPRQMIEFALRNNAGERDNFFLGAPVEDPGVLFYPVALGFRATPLLLVGLGVLVWVMVRRRREMERFWPALLLVGFAAGFVVMMTIGQKKFDRYALPVFPALGLLAGLGLWEGWRGCVERWGWGPGLRRMNSALGGGGHGPPTEVGGMRADEARRRRPVTGWLAVLLVAGLAAWPLLSVYPYYLAYFNPLLGGGAAAQRVVFVGWGEGLDRVAAYLNTKPIVLQEPAVATAYHRALQAHLRGNNAMPLEWAELADYIVPYVNSIQRNQDAEVLAPYLEGQEPEHVVWINNIEYARIYRGPHLAVERQVDVDFGGRARLDGVVLAPGSGRVRAGDEVLLRLRWEPSGGVEGLTSVVRLVSLGGQAAVQDRQALARAMREGGLLVLDTRLAVPRGLSAGGYALEASIEDGRGEAVAVAGGGWAWAIQQVTVLPAVAR